MEEWMLTTLPERSKSIAGISLVNIFARSAASSVHTFPWMARHRQSLNGFVTTKTQGIRSDAMFPSISNHGGIPREVGAHQTLYAPVGKDHA